MVEAGEKLSEADLLRIAELHVDSIRDSVATQFGVPYARRFHRFIAASPREWLFVERVGESVESACVVTLDPRTLYGRLVRATFLPLCAGALRALLTRPAFRRFLVRFLAEHLGGHPGVPEPPQITQLFTSERRRGEGLGAKLLVRVEARLAAGGFERVHVWTADEPGNRALGFYERNGFCRDGSQTEGGRRFAALSKPLPVRPKSLP